MTFKDLRPAGSGEVRDFVYNTLCDHESLHVGAFPMTEKVLVRKGTPCGMFFCLHGPRSVKFTAVWGDGQEQGLVLWIDW